jgi:hypothetical protein
MMWPVSPIFYLDEHYLHATLHSNLVAGGWALRRALRGWDRGRSNV